MAIVYMELLVDGMTGKYCVYQIKKALASMKGVQKAEVDFKSKKVIIDYSAELITLSAIMQPILSMGYSICGFREAGFLRKVV